MSADEVQVWLVPDERSDRVLAHLLGVLDAGERQRAAAYRSADDRRRFVVAHGAVRHIVAGRTGAAAAEIRFVRGPHGKPEVADPGSCVQVNLSHSGDVAMVAVTAGRRVGVDVQRIVPGLDTVAMARRYFPAEEAEFVRAAADPVARAARFARLWSRKEALVKAHGGRLTQGLRVPVTPPVAPPGNTPAGDAWPAGYRITDVPAPPGYRAAVALSGLADYRVTPRRWASPAPPP
ncbi:4'-phosphopantetheinyl transferase superfamily protein [Streptomyces cocklensis]|uniref:ACPS domain-containing protein n=1 Tax=Actinacidiphila cocklensis TaxID=887465 RepID=A0A9W4DYK3_9ACTN|nr:4'-phosphopantetheinyl transferase superfamily protein [Actinacidiphila cocklensis]MDD1057673.1 4'-phosphopantetheinyl transferase superfamily protein [Actinacidiphila cocklensis]WSX78818.1 4'-phosphopantetheinyl transferase superfamily protein [Streptomyces sp. NBC_00899]CAG6398373.1 ACPS domain-containing protein [Actinacidiphila cocklensis]